MAIQIAAPLPDTAYDYYRMTQGPFKLMCATGELFLVRGDVFGVRPSTNGKLIRLIKLGAPNKVYTLNFGEGRRLAAMSKPHPI